MINYRYEYRINKKGAECFRTQDREQAMQRFAALASKRPGVYSVQHRCVRLDKYGISDRDYLGRPQWSPWELVTGSTPTAR